MLFFRKILIRAMKFRYQTLVMFTLLFVVFNSWFMSVIEPKTFENTFHAMWWLLTTMTTVGYGDVSPTTEFGRIWAMLIVYTVGIGLFGTIIGLIVESVSHYKRMKEEGRLNYKGENHYVVIGWTTKSKSTIKELFAGDDQAEVVLIDELDKTPLEHDRFTYVNGSATDFETLRKAKIEKSKAVLLFSPEGITNSDLADGKTLLVASTIESYDEETENNIYTIAEILNEKHVGNFKHVKIDEFILSQESVSNLMAKSAQTKGSSHLFTQLLSHQDGENGSDLWEVKRDPTWITYGDAYEDLKGKGAQLIADRKDLNIIRKLNEPLPTDAVLFVICDKKTFQSI